MSIAKVKEKLTSQSKKGSHDNPFGSYDNPYVGTYDPTYIKNLGLKPINFKETANAIDNLYSEDLEKLNDRLGEEALNDSNVKEYYELQKAFDDAMKSHNEIMQELYGGKTELAPIAGQTRFKRDELKRRLNDIVSKCTGFDKDKANALIKDYKDRHDDLKETLASQNATIEKRLYTLRKEIYDLKVYQGELAAEYRHMAICDVKVKNELKIKYNTDFDL